MTPETFARATELSQRLGMLRESIKAGGDAFLKRESASDFEVRIRPEARKVVRDTIMADLRAQLASAEAEFEAL